MDKQHSIDELFAKARKQSPVASFDSTRKRFLKEVAIMDASTGNGRSFTPKKWIIMLAVITSLTLGTIFMRPNENAPQQTVSPPQKAVTSSVKRYGRSPSESMAKTTQQIPVNRTSDLPVVLQHFLPNATPISFDREGSVFIRTIEPFSPVAADEPYIFPKLTEEEIAVTNKQKKVMLKALSKFDRKDYAYIPSGTFDYAGKTVSVQSFYMQTTEVTNFEYRTFLFDLLIQNRKDEFLIAKPDQTAWTTFYGMNMQPMTDMYFSHSAHNNYPMVNISREGAELYCKWLSEELHKYVGEKKAVLYNDVRLPSRTEWVFAASAEGKYVTYPWLGTQVRNSKGIYLANFTPSEGNSLEDGILHTGNVNSYEASDNGLYCLSGNVSEMVWNSDNAKTDPGTAGGNWASSAEEISLYASDPYTGVTDARPTIGFRVVMTFLPDK